MHCEFRLQAEVAGNFAWHAPAPTPSHQKPEAQERSPVASLVPQPVRQSVPPPLQFRLPAHAAVEPPPVQAPAPSHAVNVVSMFPLHDFAAHAVVG